MLAKKYRLPIAECSTKRTLVKRTPFFTTKTFTSSLPYSRFGVVISKKVDGRASARNRLKRIIFSVLNSKLVSLAPHDTLIIVSPSIRGLKTKDAIIEELLRSI